MRTFKIVAPLIALLLTTAAAGAQQIPRIAYINSERIINDSPVAQAAQQAFEAEVEGYRQEVTSLGEALQRMIADYEQQQATMTPVARTAKENDIRLRQTEYETRLRELEAQAGQRQQALVAPVMETITGIIDQLRLEGSYAMILDAASTAILSADPSLDLTDEVLRRLNAEAEGDSPSR